MSKELSPPYSNDENKRALARGKADWTFDTDESKKAFYFSNGDSFSKIRGMINLMRSKVKTKFARKNKKGLIKEYYGPL